MDGRSPGRDRREPSKVEAPYKERSCKAVPEWTSRRELSIVEAQHLESISPDPYVSFFCLVGVSVDLRWCLGGSNSDANWRPKAARPKCVVLCFLILKMHIFLDGPAKGGLEQMQGGRVVGGRRAGEEQGTTANCPLQQAKLCEIGFEW